MTRRFNAFSFVDRIDESGPGAPVRGRFQIPPGLSEFPSSLVAEAVGQLAAWVSMDRLDYSLRPVAGVAGEVRFLRPVGPGAVLDLEVELAACSASDVAYSGWAASDGERVVELENCLGPMLPMEDFDDPGAVRERFGLLCGEGAPPGRFAGVEAIGLEGEAPPGALELETRLEVPQSADFFGDHFPRRPVFPATLLLDSLARAIVKLTAGAGFWPAATPLVPVRARDVKMRAFVEPGQELDVKVKLEEPAGEAASARFVVFAQGKRVAHGRLDIAPREAGR